MKNKILNKITARWFLPMNTKFRREALLSLLVSFITNGTDIVDFFGYVDEEKTFENKNLLVAILSILFHFNFNLQTILSNFFSIIKFFSV